MRSLILIAVGVFNLTVLLILPAAAQSKEEWRLCKVAEYDARITACTRIIEKYSNRADVASRAYAYRSDAYKELGKKTFSREIAELGAKDLEKSVSLGLNWGARTLTPKEKEFLFRGEAAMRPDHAVLCLLNEEEAQKVKAAIRTGDRKLVDDELMDAFAAQVDDTLGENGRGGVPDYCN